MAINVEFYSFSKRINSTKRPDSGAVTYACNMINGFSLTHPVLQIAGANNQFNPTLYNYARIEDFNDRYYFVEDWKYDKGLWSAYLAVDELASWKQTIGASRQFVSRCATEAFWNEDMIDERVITLPKRVTSSVETYNYPFVTDINEGCVLLQVIGRAGRTHDSGISISDIYALTVPEFKKFKLEFSSSSFFKQFENGLDGAIQRVLLCRWLPFKVERFLGSRYDSIKEIYIDSEHKITLDFSPYIVHADHKHCNPELVFNISRIIHGQSPTVSNLLNSSLYTQHSFIWKPVGIIPINADVFALSKILTAKTVVDVETGNAYFTLYADDNILYSTCFPCGFEISLSHDTVNSWGIITSLLTTAASVATGGIAGVVGGVASSVAGISSSVAQTHLQAGGGGSMAAYLLEKPRLQTDYAFVEPNEDVDRFGKPAHKSVTISNLYGFIQCENADFKAEGATRAEITAVNNYMNGGFYYE